MSVGMTSPTGKSSVSAPKARVKGSPNGGAVVVSGRAIVNKPVNAHRANPGFKKGK